MPNSTMPRKRILRVRPLQEEFQLKDPFDVVISFDTTGSMRDFLAAVQRGAHDIVTQLRKKIPDVQIAILVHKDYADREESYVTKILDFTDDPNEVHRFVNRTEAGGGDDEPECYELALREVRTRLRWRTGSQRALVMIGDDRPHEALEYETIIKKYPEVTEAILWEEEVSKLMEMGCAIWGLQHGGKEHAKYFWEGMAAMTYQYNLNIADTSHAQDILLTIIFKMKDGRLHEEHRTQMRRKYAAGMPPILDEAFRQLRCEPGSSGAIGGGSSVTIDEVSAEEQKRYLRRIRAEVEEKREIWIREREMNAVERGYVIGSAIAGPVGGLVGGVIGGVYSLFK